MIFRKEWRLLFSAHTLLRWSRYHHCSTGQEKLSTVKKELINNIQDDIEVLYAHVAMVQNWWFALRTKGCWFSPRLRRVCSDGSIVQHFCSILIKHGIKINLICCLKCFKMFPDSKWEKIIKTSWTWYCQTSGRTQGP